MILYGVSAKVKEVWAVDLDGLVSLRQRAWIWLDR
jgi:hypothetical protein